MRQINAHVRCCAPVGAGVGAQLWTGEWDGSIRVRKLMTGEATGKIYF